MVCPLCRADRSASLPPLLLITPIVAATLLAGALSTLLLPTLPGLVTRLRLPGLLAALLAGALTALLMPALVLMTLLVAILLHDRISSESKMCVSCCWRETRQRVCHGDTHCK